jgi:hypothetical protein
LYERLLKRVKELEEELAEMKKGEIHELTPATGSKPSGYIPIAFDVVLYQFHDIVDPKAIGWRRRCSPCWWKC